MLTKADSHARDPACSHSGMRLRQLGKRSADAPFFCKQTHSLAQKISKANRFTKHHH